MGGPAPASPVSRRSVLSLLPFRFIFRFISVRCNSALGAAGLCLPTFPPTPRSPGPHTPPSLCRAPGRARRTALRPLRLCAGCRSGAAPCGGSGAAQLSPGAVFSRRPLRSSPLPGTRRYPSLFSRLPVSRAQPRDLHFPPAPLEAPPLPRGVPASPGGRPEGRSGSAPRPLSPAAGCWGWKMEGGGGERPAVRWGRLRVLPVMVVLKVMCCSAQPPPRGAERPRCSRWVRAAHRHCQLRRSKQHGERRVFLAAVGSGHPSASRAGGGDGCVSSLGHWIGAINRRSQPRQG